MSEAPAHIIQNFDKLATSALRKTALRIAEAGLLAINTTRAVDAAVAYNPKNQRLTAGGKNFDLSKFERVMCIGFGKAAFEAVSALHKKLAGRIACGFVIDLKGGDLGNITCRIGTHPYPTKVNIEATKELLAMLESCTEKDLVLCVVSGGGSALLCYPHDLSCELEVAIIRALTAKGASITELNTVRKHISNVKGGHLAKIMYPATVISLIFSDVPGDDLGMVASGPTVKDGTTNRDAAEILKKYDVLAMCNLPGCKLQETPKDEKYFARVHNVLAVSARHALAAMRREAEDLGFAARIFSEHFQGEARLLGPQIVGHNRPHECLLGAGESTVKIIGRGLGGRNQEMALAALPHIQEGQVFVTVASDGHDYTDAAGAIADESGRTRAGHLFLNVGWYLNDNDSFHFFEKLGDQLMTGITGANVSDFFVCLRK